jgi:hypothetical protein
VIAASDIDRMLLSFCDARWRKVARIIGNTYTALEKRDIPISHGIAKLMDARMAVLVRSGKLEAKGNIKRWRYSEARLPASYQNRRALRPVLPRGPVSKRKQRVEAAE